MTQVQGYKAGRVARLRRHPLTFVFGFPLTGRGFLTPQLVWLGIAVRAPFSVLTGFESTLLMVLWPVCAVAATWRARVVDGTLICTTFGIRTLVIDLRRSGECRLVSLPVAPILHGVIWGEHRGRFRLQPGGWPAFGVGWRVLEGSARRGGAGWAGVGARAVSVVPVVFGFVCGQAMRAMRW